VVKAGMVFTTKILKNKGEILMTKPKYRIYSVYSTVIGGEEL
jgi:hypothetical protein